MNRQFSKEAQMVNKHMKKCSIILARKEIQIKTTLAGKWMELEIVMLSEASQTQKDEYHMFSLIFRI
jgi:hypothetical protein